MKNTDTQTKDANAVSSTDLLCRFWNWVKKPRNRNYNETWDIKLNKLMDEHKWEAQDKYTATIGGVEVWISNHHYASFTPRLYDLRPSLKTVDRAIERLLLDTL